MRLRPLLRPLLLGFVVALLDCATLDPLATQTCGNGVVDANEDCDTFPSDGTGRCGAPTEGDSACRLHCGKQSSGEVLACPDGWGCSVKGICREPTGTFKAALAPVSAGVTNLAVGDFDGDGRKDLMGSGRRTLDNASRVRVHFFDDSASLVEPIASLPSQLVSPVVIDLDGNGLDDIAFGLASPNGVGGMGVMSGLSNRTFLPVVFPAFTVKDEDAIPVTVVRYTDVELPNGGDNAILLFARNATGALLTSIDSEVGAGTSLRVALPVGPEAVHGRPLAARVYDDPKSTCGEVVAAADTPEGPRVLVFSPCTFAQAGPSDKKTPRWAKGGLDSVVVPQPFTPKEKGGRGVLLADVNGDGRLDLLVDTTGGVFVAPGTGTAFGAFSLASDKSTMPLAAGDINLDGKVDYVFDNSVFVSTTATAGDAGAGDGGATTSYEVAVFQQQQKWTDALIGDFNGDFFPDVVTMRAGSPDLQVYAGGLGGFTLYTVNTDGIVLSITKGDFDGDHVDDIGIAQTRAGSDGSDLAIAYGRAIGGPEPARVIGRVDSQKGIVAIPRGLVGLADFGVYATSGQANPDGLRSTSFTLLVGSGDRQTLAPLLLVDKASQRPLEQARALAGQTRAWLPVGLAAGPFGDRKHPAVLAYALGITLSRKTGTFENAVLAGAWVADADTAAPGGLDAPREVTQIDDKVTLLDPVSKEVTVSTVARDVDNRPDGLSELVVVANFPGSKDPGVQIIHPTDKSSQPIPTFLPGVKLAPGAQIDAVDVDGDGFRDLVGVFGTAPDSRIVVFLNDGKGNFVVPGIPLAMATPSSGAPDGPRAFASITIGGAPVLSGGKKSTALAVVTGQAVLLAKLRSDKSGFDVTPVAVGLGALTGVAAGDFNGDGVEDIAVADGGAIRIIPQLPARSRP